MLDINMDVMTYFLELMYELLESTAVSHLNYLVGTFSLFHGCEFYLKCCDLKVKLLNLAAEAKLLMVIFFEIYFNLFQCKA